MPDLKSAGHIVLVHGAWQGSWAFGAWTPLLEARGWTVHAVDLPGNGWGPAADGVANLDTYTAHVVSVIEAIGEPVVLVGHSGGGITVSQVAEAVPSQVRALVYLAGMMLPSGMTFVDLLKDVLAGLPGLHLDGIASWLDWNADHTATSVQIEGALRCFVQDCEPEAARAAAALLRPQPESGRDMRNRLTPASFGTVPRIYVECDDDRSVFPVLQQRMQALSPGATRILMHGGHVPQLAQPALLTERLLDALAQGEASHR
jgi:pimeloyl-ACP methyl ester carboxylesterase